MGWDKVNFNFVFKQTLMHMPCEHYGSNAHLLCMMREEKCFNILSNIHKWFTINTQFHNIHTASEYINTKTQWHSHWGCRGAECNPWQRKNCQKSGKRGGKSGKIWKKKEKSGRKGNNREGFFTLPLLTDRAGYATAKTQNLIFFLNLILQWYFQSFVTIYYGNDEFGFTTW